MHHQITSFIIMCLLFNINVICYIHKKAESPYTLCLRQFKKYPTPHTKRSNSRPAHKPSDECRFPELPFWHIALIKNTKLNAAQAGVSSNPVTADWNVIGDRKKLTIIGSHLSAKAYPAVIQGIEKGTIKTERFFLTCMNWHLMPFFDIYY